MATLYDYDHKIPEERLVVDAPAIRIKSACNLTNSGCLHAVDTGNGYCLKTRAEIKKLLSDRHIVFPTHFT